MSISIQGQTGWASIPNSIGRSRLPYPTLALLINLLTHSEGFSASYELIKEQTGMASATISAAIKNLEKLGLLTVKKLPIKGGKYASNHYIFHADNLWKLTPEFVDQRLERGKAASKNEAGKKSTASGNEVGTASLNEVAPLQEMKAKNDHLEPPVENDQPPITPQGGDDRSSADRFDDFWEVVPKKVGKQAAKRAWVKAVKSTAPDVIIEGMKRYRDDPNRSDAFTKNPQGWLNDGRWMDDPLPAREERQTRQGAPRRSNTMEAWLGISEGTLDRQGAFGGFEALRGDIIDGQVIDQRELGR